MKFRSKLVGSNFRPIEAQTRAIALMPGEFVLLEPEPTNKYDPNAIKVYSANEDANVYLGYIIARDRQSEGLTLAADIIDKVNDENTIVSATVSSNGHTKDTIYLELDIREVETEVPGAA